MISVNVLERDEAQMHVGHGESFRSLVRPSSCPTNTLSEREWAHMMSALVNRFDPWCDPVPALPTIYIYCFPHRICSRFCLVALQPSE